MSASKSIITALIVGLAIGWYMFYGQPFADQIGTYLNLAPSSYLYGTIGVAIFFLSSFFAKLLTHGMDKKK